MNEVTEILPPEGQVPAFPTEEQKARAIITEIQARARAHVPDIATNAGRAEIKSLAYDISRTKTAMDTAGKELVADLKAKIKPIDGIRKIFRDELDALRDEVRAPLTAWEAEKARREAEIEARFGSIRRKGEVAYDEGSESIQKRIEWMLDTKANATPDEFDKRAAEADQLCSDKIATLRMMLEQAEAREETARERDALIARERERAAKEEADRKEREAAEAQAKAEREAKDREEREARETELKAAREAQAKAEREAAAARDAELAAKAEAEKAAERERARIEEERRLAEARAKDEADEARRREEVEKHRAAAIEETANSIAGILEDADEVDTDYTTVAVALLDAIIEGQLAHLKFEVAA